MCLAFSSAFLRSALCTAIVWVCRKARTVTHTVRASVSGLLFYHFEGPFVCSHCLRVFRHWLSHKQTLRTCVTNKQMHLHADTHVPTDGWSHTFLHALAQIHTQSSFLHAQAQSTNTDTHAHTQCKARTCFAMCLLRCSKCTDELAKAESCRSTDTCEMAEG